jgi:RNA polymerase sigma-70 factor, ECF subfamily
VGDREVDEVLVRRAQRGDKRAFELLIKKYEGKLARLLSRYIRDASEVQDVTQQAFLRAYLALPTFRGDSAFYTWLYRIGVNLAKNHLAASARREAIVREADTEDSEENKEFERYRDLNTPEDELASKEMIETIHRTLEEMPAELRMAITLRAIEGLPYEEIARIMRCPIGTVRSRIFRAREAIAEKLRPHLGTSKKWRGEPRH